MNVQINFTHANLGLFLSFLCNLGSIHGHFRRFCSSLFAKQSRLLCAVSTHKSLPHQITGHQFTMKASGESLISSPCHGYCDLFFVGKFFESFRFWAILRALWNLDDYVLRGEREHGRRGSGKSILHDKTWIFLPSGSLMIAREWCLELSCWMNVYVYKMFPFTTQRVVIEFPERSQISKSRNRQKYAKNNS